MKDLSSVTKEVYELLEKEYEDRYEQVTNDLKNLEKTYISYIIRKEIGLYDSKNSEDTVSRSIDSLKDSIRLLETELKEIAYMQNKLKMNKDAYCK